MTERAEGRILRSLSGFYDVQTADGLVTCRARGILRKEGNSPLTGDLVEITVERGKGMVEKILPRKNKFIRPAVANIDALVVFAANVNPVTEPYLIDRVAAIAGDQNVPVILCINKCDLDPAVDLVRIYEHAGFRVICTSAETGEGVQELKESISGKLVAFTGNSGVGKSSILNAICPTLNLETNITSSKLGRGKHTTRTVSLYNINGGFVADTPGFSSIDFENLSERIYKDDLPTCFPEFADFTDCCKFSVSCSHTTDKGCAVLGAVNDGIISKERHESYLRMYEEVKNFKKWEEN